MKRLLALTLALMLCISLFGCNNKNATTSPDIKDINNETQTQQVSPTETAETFAPKNDAPTLPEGAITSDEAIDVALKKAELSKSQVIGLWSELDYDDGVLIYEVDFSDGKFDYDCDVDALNGKVLKYDKELDD